jgi:S-adenosylmethionine hydrolase
MCARLAMHDIEPTDIGSSMTELVKLSIPEITVSSESIDGEVITVDRFGNAITNIPTEELSILDDPTSVRVYVDDRRVAVFGKTFSSAAKGETVAYPGSAGLIEIAVNGGNLVERYSIKRGSKVRIVSDDS